MSLLSKSSVNKVRIVLNQIFKNAVEDGIIATNIIDSKRYVMSKKATKRDALSKEHVQSIIYQLDKLDDDEKLFLGLAIFTGMRRGEIIALMWQDIDLEKRLIHVQHAVTYNMNRPVIGNPKSAAGIRFISINAHLLSILTSTQERTDFVVKNRKDERIPLRETAFKD